MFYALLQVTNTPRWGHSFFNVIWWQKWPTAIFFGKCKLNGSKKKHFAVKMAAQRQNGGGCVINGEKMLLFLANRVPAACCGNRPGSAIEIGGISSEKLTLFRHPTVRSKCKDCPNFQVTKFMMKCWLTGSFINFWKSQASTLLLNKKKQNFNLQGPPFTSTWRIETEK